MLTERRHLQIAGSTAPATRDLVKVTSSIDGREIGSYPKTDAGDVDNAVRSAREALDAPQGWSQWTADARATAMESLATAIKSRVTSIAELIVHEVGSPLAFATGANGVTALALLKDYARLARSMQTEATRPSRSGRTLVRTEPVGVVALIVPWNVPIGILFFKLAPALAAGCTVVIKPSPETALDTYLIGDAIAESGIPDGVVNILPGGRDIGELLIAHPGVDAISFTGSTAAGRRVAEVAGRALKPVVLELGGKSAAVVLDDAPTQLVLDALYGSSFLNNGQACTNSSRILVPASRRDELVAAITDRVSSWVVGDPRDPATQIGPLVSSSHHDRVVHYIERGLADGAQISTGGPQQMSGQSGTTVRPTVFFDVEPTMAIAREEIFGPVISVAAYEGSDDEAIRAANDSEYGLAGTVFSIDVERALAVGKRIRSGSIGINGYSLDLGAPFGGRKSSGLGSELGPEGIEAFQTYQSIYLP